MKAEGILKSSVWKHPTFTKKQNLHSPQKLNDLQVVYIQRDLYIDAL